MRRADASAAASVIRTTSRARLRSCMRQMYRRYCHRSTLPRYDAAMRRVFVALALLACACSRSTEPERGPAYTPAVANLLHARAGDCAVTRSDGLEHRTC